MLLLVVHKLFGLGDERAATAEEGQHPSELETEDVEKEVDVAREVLEVPWRLLLPKANQPRASPRVA